MKVKFYKTGENRKLSPRRNGPWTVLSKLPNGVNFHIINDKTREEKVVHHDRINPVKGDRSHQSAGGRARSLPEVEPEPAAEEVTESSDTDSDAHSEYQPSSGSSSEEGSATEGEDNVAPVPRYARRNRLQRVIPGAMSWSDVDDAGLLN